MADGFLKGRAGVRKHLRTALHFTPIRARHAVRLGQLLPVLAAGIFAGVATAQGVPDPPPPGPPVPEQPAADEPVAPNAAAVPAQPLTPSTFVSVHGVVKNALSGDPLPRALVQVDGETGQGVLTDGDGKFDLTLPGTGLHVFQLTKPGFHDLPPGPSTTGAVENIVGLTHNVYVIEDMPGLSFAMTPTGVIQGRIDLSTGDPGQGIGVLLLRRSIQGGRASWLAVANARTNSDGAYRFAGLDTGDYTVVTEPARDSDSPGIPVAPGGSESVAWNGYAATFYPDAREFSGAAKIHLRGGDTTRANLTLNLEPFQPVRAALTAPKDMQMQAVEYGVSVLDLQGHLLSYPAQYEEETRSVQATLPDGTFALQVTATERPQMRIAKGHNLAAGGGMVLQGTSEVTVSGHPVINGLRVPLVERVATPVTVNVSHNSSRPGSGRATNGAALSISATQAGETKVDAMWILLAQGSAPGELETNVLPPGSYWVHTSINQPGFCESSFNAGGESLAREPLVVAPGGATAPVSLTLRDDCAALKLSLPPNLPPPATGEEPAYTVYVVPDFDSTVDVSGITLRQSSGGTLTVDNLTPGSYHVYTFPAPVELEYRNPDALANLPGSAQTVTLEPSSTATLIVETPHP